MPSTARRWHPIRAVNAYDIRLVWLRDHHEGTWVAVPWRLLSSTAAPFGEPVAPSMTRSSVSRAVREALPVLDVDGFGQQLGADRQDAVCCSSGARDKSAGYGRRLQPRPAVAEYRQAPSVLALFSYSYGQVARSTT